VRSELRFEGGGISAALRIRPSARARALRLKVDTRTGDVLLTVPRRVSHRKALEWAAGHRPWVEAQLARIAPAATLMPGEIIPLYGVPHLIDWAAERPRLVQIEAGRILTGGPRDGVEARLLRWLRRHALEILERETGEYAALAEVSVGRVGVGDPGSRWGSCSASGGIRYSWRLILAPDWVRRATVAHEVAHRVHMNHGPDFHRLVEQLLGADPKPARQWLRDHGGALHRAARIGRGPLIG